MKKLGTLISAWTESSEMDCNNKIYRMETLLGRRDDPLLNIYARQIIEQISKTSDKPLLLSVALKPEGRDTATFQEVLNKLLEIQTW